MRVRVVQECRRREQRTRREPQVVRKGQFIIYDLEQQTWPAVALLDDPTISRRIKHRVRRRLTTLLGQQRVLYLESLSEAPNAPVSISDITTRLGESRVLDDTSTALVDRMMQDDSISSARVVIQELDYIIRVLS